jgi:hypothetical protein
MRCRSDYDFCDYGSDGVSSFVVGRRRSVIFPP